MRPQLAAILSIPLLPRRMIAALGFAIAWGLAPSAAGAGDAVDFSRDILPILSDKCFRCHGPDPKARKADLRLDRSSSALRKDEPIIVPGKSDQSELIARITSDDELERMPPPKSNLTLTSGQVDLLKGWVDEGAKWGEHWSFVPPRRAEPPPAARPDWSRNAIDRFILARLQSEGLPPAPEARRETQLRRSTLDLTGLPPTLEELGGFLADASPNAYERVIDRLLASPRYGERMASEWLDLARYADTHGYQMDRYRPMWPWRDWVVRAFNRNQPFDEFVTWQLAGDLLPNANQDQRLATAFNRLHMQNEEGGVVEEEFRVAYVVDRVTTFGTTFLGLTLECARCHDHKFDPITQRDFYSLFAFFQNIDESGQTSYFTAAMPVPTVMLADDATRAKLAELDRRITAGEKALDQIRAQAAEPFETWLSSRAGNPPEPLGLVGAFSFEEISGNKLPNSADAGHPASAVEEPKLVAGKLGKAAELFGDNGFTFPGIGHFTRIDPFTLSLWIQMQAPSPRAVVLHHTKAPVDAGSRGYELLLEDGKVAFGLHHMWPGNSLKVRTKEAIAPKQWLHVAVTYDGSSRASGVRVYQGGALVPVETVRDGLSKDTTYEGGEPDLAIGYRFRDNGFKGGLVDEFRLYNRSLTALEVADLAEQPGLKAAWETPCGSRTDWQREGLRAFFLATAFPPFLQQSAAVHELRKQQSQLINPIPEAMVMKEMERSKPAFVLRRGAYDAPGEPVTANTPAALPPFPGDQPRNRLGLARWLLAPDQPLMARVTVNRLWQMMFGRGIVETSDNLGNQGAVPTQPELLDWLAAELVDSGWDIKHLLRLIANSATYRQSSQATPELLARDPANHLLGRGPARRLTAEMLRDQALAVSGLLVEIQGGPAVKPYQPEGLWEVAMGSPQYDQAHGSDLHRRSLYTFWKRTVAHPAMVTFDAAERNVCIARRQSTSTPLQALVLLNDTQIVEAARLLSARMLKEGGAIDAERVAWMFRLVTGRLPNAPETTILQRLLGEQRALFAADPSAVKDSLAVGEAMHDPDLDPVALAAGTVLAEAILNHDDAIMRR